MAATVYNGSGTFSHTNTTNKNQRILIYYLRIENNGGSFTTMNWGNLVFTDIAGPSGGQVWGLKLGINAYSSSASSMVANMSVKGISSGAGGGLNGGYHLPLEGYIKEGETFALSNPDSGVSVQIKYMFTVIDEE
tara:strand:+ start:1384 stop:1788 length:405 start_codon:yes stop_codon:yes gene_type:complete